MFMASVTTMEGTRKVTVIQPLSPARNIPTRIAAGTQRIIGTPYTASSPAVKLTKPRIVPAEMSMLPVKMTRDIAIAPTIVGLTSSIMLKRPLREENCVVSDMYPMKARTMRPRTNSRVTMRFLVMYPPLEGQLKNLLLGELVALQLSHLGARLH